GPAYSGKNGPGSRFFRQTTRDGHPFFVDETERAGITDRGWAFAASACDFDGDGDDDLYVANDFGTNCLYENVSTPGHPRFREIAKRAGVLDDGYGMGVAWGDYENDGRFDLHVSDFSSPYRWLIRSPKLPMPPLPAVVQAVARPIVVPMLLRRCQGDGLYRNRGDGTFERTSESAGVADGGWAWGTEFVDLDGDGREDLLVVNGMWEAAPGGKSDEVKFWNEMAAEGVAFHDGYWGGIDFGADGMASRCAKHFFRNLGGGRFEDQAWIEGFDTRADTRGLAFGDLDGDGAPDVVLSTFRGPMLAYRNGWTGVPRITLRLVSPAPGNREAIGAVVRLTAGDLTQLREVRAGSSYLSCSAKDLYFGLGTAAKADSIEVRWPDGRREIRRDVRPGLVLWKEGEEPR
ncbi:MAG TPA: CRTAC1 family protein, partial [Thermoanaerobaculia bacterium]|nr:CRTAC1 family protein [Thermoanaerobaculia bacterium]